MRRAFVAAVAFGWLLAACGGPGQAPPTAIPADVVRPEQSTPALSTAEPRYRLDPSTREPVFVDTLEPASSAGGGSSSGFDRAALLRSYLMDQPPSALGIAPGGAVVFDAPGGAVVATVLPAGSVTVTGRSQDGAWLAVFTDSSLGGWTPAGSLVLFGADDLTVVDSAFSPGPVATLIAEAMTPVSTPLDLLIERRATEQAGGPFVGETPAAIDSAGASLGQIAGGNNVNMREGPSTETRAIASLAPGSALIILGLSDDGAWARVRTPLGDGWVAATLVESE